MARFAESGGHGGDLKASAGRSGRTHTPDVILRRNAISFPEPGVPFDC
jgi:hypothetical protein